MSPCFPCIFITLILLVSANGAPILARKLLRYRYAFPVDCGFNLRDGRPLFGNAKTWRGLLASICLTTVMAWLLDLAPFLGGMFAMLSMTGDLLASYCKRRLGKVESSRARGFDTLPESLLPVWVLKGSLALSGLDIILIVGLFFLMEEFVSPLLYKWHIRLRPY
ncbi:MAG: CDP-archaeol synthase [Methylococcaceae bacterium]|nr:CDP-archaeol synthase [Methylococcaceae bacterium]